MLGFQKVDQVSMRHFPHMLQHIYTRETLIPGFITSLAEINIFLNKSYANSVIQKYALFPTSGVRGQKLASASLEPAAIQTLQSKGHDPGSQS